MGEKESLLGRAHTSQSQRRLFLILLAVCFHIRLHLKKLLRNPASSKDTAL